MTKVYNSHNLFPCDPKNTEEFLCMMSSFEFFYLNSSETFRKEL